MWCLYCSIYKNRTVAVSEQITNAEGCAVPLCPDCKADPKVLELVAVTWDDKPFNG